MKSSIIGNIDKIINNIFYLYINEKMDCHHRGYY